MSCTLPCGDVHGFYSALGVELPASAPHDLKLAREMYDETGDDGKRKHTVAEIAAEFGVSRSTIYRHLAKTVA